ncbi:MAG: hypothetical protein HY801_05825, partial [Candidatus Lindowbacteria bacterium]|nr:hypothetical protein [Candidatus Lindowbacteria bacterium]
QRKTGAEEPDSEYVDSDAKSEQKEEGGGLFDFLPFVGEPPKKVESEKLTPSPLPRESKPVLSKKKMEELQMAADRWLTTSEYTEPTLRRNSKGEYYRDYIVFANEYKAEVLRGDDDEKPFVGNVYVKGDYFHTKPHFNSAAAQADFQFDYQAREFRLIFDRIEKWDYSQNLDDEPFTFTERWEFRKLQARPVIGISEDAKSSSPDATRDKADAPKAANE